MPAQDLLIPALAKLDAIIAKLPTSTADLATTALQVSNATLTTPRIQKLDNLDALVSAQSIPVPSTTQASDRWSEHFSVVKPTLGVEELDASRTASGATGWVNFKTVTGAGFITFAVARLHNEGSVTETDGRIRLVIDSNTIIEGSAKSLSPPDQRGISLVGIWDFEVGGGGCAHVPFASGFTIEWYRGVSAASYDMTAECWLQHYN